MLTAVERVLILKGADLLKGVGPRHLLELADVTTEIEIAKGSVIYHEQDLADALYMVVEGRVRLSSGGRSTSEVGPGEAFGTWALVDDSERGHRAECLEDGRVLALRRDDFYDVAAGDLTLLQEMVRVLAKRLRALAAEHPEDARVEGEGIEKPEALVEAEAASTGESARPGASLAAAATGQPAPAPARETSGASPQPKLPVTEIAAPEPIAPAETLEPPKP